MTWIALVLIHVICLVVYTLLLRKTATRSTSPIFIGALMVMGFLLPVPVYILFGLVRTDLSFLEMAWLLFGGTMLAGVMVITTWALSKIDASLFTIIYNLRLFFITLFAFVFLGELPTGLQILGGVVIFVSIVLLNLHIEQRWKSSAVLAAFLATLWFSAHATVEKFNISLVSPIETYFTYFSLIATILLWSLVFVMKLDAREQWRSLHHKTMGWLVLTRVGSGLSYVYALKFGTVAVTNYVSGMSVALIVLAGIYLLGEQEHKAEKLRAVVVSCVGLTLIVLSKIFGV